MADAKRSPAVTEPGTRGAQSPDEAAQAVLQFPPDALEASIVALDLDKDGYCVEKGRYRACDAASWVQDFRSRYVEWAPMYKRRALPPSVAVFADRLGEEDTRTLLQAGAVLYDRSLACNRDFQTFGKLMAHLAHTAQPARAAPTYSQASPGTISAEDLAACNSYPHGITEKQLAAVLKVSNSE